MHSFSPCSDRGFLYQIRICSLRTFSFLAFLCSRALRWTVRKSHRPSKTKGEEDVRRWQSNWNKWDGRFHPTRNTFRHIARFLNYNQKSHSRSYCNGQRATVVARHTCGSCDGKMRLECNFAFVRNKVRSLSDANPKIASYGNHQLDRAKNYSIAYAHKNCEYSS